MLKIVGLIVVLSLIGAAIYYFGFYKRGKINDRDGDYIPDVVEDTIEDVKEKAAEVKRRAKSVKKELKDVADAAKEVINQAGDVVEAAKGKKRQGRKPKSKK
jgi:F0F1-type ATP synthase membrane subunit b/b'